MTRIQDYPESLLFLSLIIHFFPAHRFFLDIDFSVVLCKCLQISAPNLLLTELIHVHILTIPFMYK
jgi:hypothetical protein